MFGAQCRTQYKRGNLNSNELWCKLKIWYHEWSAAQLDTRVGADTIPYGSLAFETSTRRDDGGFLSLMNDFNLN